MIVKLQNTNVFPFQLVTKDVKLHSLLLMITGDPLRLLIFLVLDGLCHSLMIVQELRESIC